MTKLINISNGNVSLLDASISVNNLNTYDGSFIILNVEDSSINNLFVKDGCMNHLFVEDVI